MRDGRHDPHVPEVNGGADGAVQPVPEPLLEVLLGVVTQGHVVQDLGDLARLDQHWDQSLAPRS